MSFRSSRKFCDSCFSARRLYNFISSPTVGSGGRRRDASLCDAAMPGVNTGIKMTICDDHCFTIGMAELLLTFFSIENRRKFNINKHYGGSKAFMSGSILSG